MQPLYHSTRAYIDTYKFAAACCDVCALFAFFYAQLLFTTLIIPALVFLAMAPTHWAIYCPLGDKCGLNAKKVGGWKNSENEARSALYQHLMNHSGHMLSDEDATKHVEDSCLDTWGPDDRKKKAEAPAADEPPRQRRAIGDAAAATSVASSSSAGGGGGQFTQMRLRAEHAEDILYQVNGAITRMVESMTKAVATMETAAQMASSALKAFNASHHELKASLEQVQQLYSVAAPARTMSFNVV